MMIYGNILSALEYLWQVVPYLCLFVSELTMQTPWASKTCQPEPWGR